MRCLSFQWPRSIVFFFLVGLIVVMIGCCAGCAGTPASAPPPSEMPSAGGASSSAAPLPASPPPQPASTPGAVVTTTMPLRGRLPGDVTPVAQQLELEIDPRQDDFAGRVVIDITLAASRTTIWLHARDLVVDTASITTSGATQAARFAIDDALEGLARIDVASPLPPGPSRVSLSFRGALRRDLEGLYGVRAPGPDGVVDAYVFSQFEPLAAREAFPCFDEPGWKIPYSVTVTHPANDEAVTNTQRSERTPLPDGRLRDRFATTAPLPTYLLAFVVGPVDIVPGATLAPSVLRSQTVPLRAITVRGRGAQVKKALADTARVLVVQEQLFGIGYPYDKIDIVAVPDFGAGAMENAGLVTFRDTLLFVDEQSPIRVQKGSLETIAHELAHQWFGNLVTMAWWDDLWLNEAFASWFEARTVQLVRPDFDTALGLREGAAWVMGEDSLVSARRIREAIDDRGDIENAFDSITYTKGSAVIAMFEEYIDQQTRPGTFLTGVTRYLNDHRFGSATTDDFLRAISQAAGFDITPAFSTFLDQPGVPLVHASCAVNEKTSGTATLFVSSERFLPVGSLGEKNRQWDIPMCASFLLDGRPQKKCALLKGGTGRIELGLPACPAAVHPNADGAGYYRFTMPAPQLQALSATVAALTAGERIALAASLRGAFAAATLPFDEVLRAARSLAGDVEPSVALTAEGLLAFAGEDVVETEAERALVDVERVRLYQPALNRLGLRDRPGDTARDRERRQALFRVVVDAGGAARRVAVAAGRELFSSGTTKRVAQDLWPAALVAAVEDGARRGTVDKATWDAWLDQARRQKEPRLRQIMLRALAVTEDPVTGDRALGLIFDDTLNVSERGVGIFAQAGQRRTRERAFSFVTARWDDVTKRLPEGWRPGLATAFAGFCAEADAARVEGFFLPKVPSTPGLDLALAQTVETIRLCAAKKQAHAASVRALYGSSAVPTLR
jgi:alanyl aminopeptidase